jgi:hypothetical protein
VNERTQLLFEKGVRILRESPGAALVTARIFAKTKFGKGKSSRDQVVWLLWINGQPVAEADTSNECRRLLAAILLAEPGA